MTNIFIDTNVLLSFYGYCKDDLEELRKLIPVLENDSHKLLITTQLKDEFYRNREKKVSETLKNFERETLKVEIPQIFEGYEEFEDLKSSMNNSMKYRSKMIDKFRKDIVENSLVADKIVEALFSKGKSIDINPEVVNKAIIRMQSGNPPGKGRSLGDAINWELLLGSIPCNEKLHLISQDTDYASEFDKDRLAQFLEKEWSNTPRGEITFHNTLTRFFERNFPNIKLANQLETELHIRELTNSPNFRSSRKYLKLLSKNESLSDSQINAIVDAAITNNQIRWILTDEDIAACINNIVKEREEAIDKNAYKKLVELMTPTVVEADPSSCPF